MRRPNNSTAQLRATPLDRLARALERSTELPERLTAAQWMVLVAHVLHGCRDGRAWPLVSTLAKKLGLSASAIKKGRSTLVRAGMLAAVDSRRGGRDVRATYLVVPDAQAGAADAWLATGKTGRPETVDASSTDSRETVDASSTDRARNGGRLVPETVDDSARFGGRVVHPQLEGTRREPPLPPKVTSAALSASGDPDHLGEGDGELRVHREERLRAICTAHRIPLHPFRSRKAISELARERIEPQDLDRWIGAELAAPDGTPTAIAAAIEAGIAAAALRRARDDPPDPRRQAASLGTADTPTTPQTTPAAQCGTWTS